jgi:serine/threonine kinase PknH
VSLNSEPTMPRYVWATPPARVHPWAQAPRPQMPPRSGSPVNTWAAPPMPGPWQQAPPQRTASTRHRWIPAAMAGFVAVLAVAAGLVATLASHTSAQTRASTTSPAIASVPSTQASGPAPAPTPLVREDALPALLLDVASVNAIMGTGDLAVNPTLTTDKLFIDTTDKPDCGGTWANANKGEYTGSAWQAVQTQYLREPARPRHEVYQSVVSFPTPQTAQDFVAKEAQRWPACSGAALTTTNPTIPAQTWWIASVGKDGDVVTAVSNREGSSGYTCQHAVTSRNNVVIDVDACGWDVTHQGTTIAQRVAEQISRTL